MPLLIDPVSESNLKQCAVISTNEVAAEKNIAYSARPQSPSMSIYSEKSLPSDAETSKKRFQSDRPSSYHGTPIIYARPDVAALVRAAVHETPANKRVLVLGCGPGGLMTEVRNTAAACIQAEGPSLELHFEHFGW